MGTGIIKFAAGGLDSQLRYKRTRINLCCASQNPKIKVTLSLLEILFMQKVATPGLYFANTFYKDKLNDELTKTAATEEDSCS